MIPDKYKRAYAVLHSAVIDKRCQGRIGGLHCRGIFGLISFLLMKIEAQQDLIERLKREKRTA